MTLQAKARAALRTCIGAMILSGASAMVAQAAESGKTLYLLGTGGPGTAVMPPFKGVYFDNNFFYYEADAAAGRQFTFGGNLVAGLDATVVADFPTFLWVPTTDLAGGTLALGLVIPYGSVDVRADAILTGPLGNAITVRRHDSAFVFGDPVVAGMLGWSDGSWHYQLSTLVNVPIGEYRDGELANLAFNRWAVDLSMAVTYRDAETGWDVSGKAGFTLNGANDATDYDSGTDFHVEASLERIVSPQWSVGLQGYYYKQVSDDTGDGARLGGFRGEIAGIGGTAAYNFTVAQNPLTLRGRVMWEFEAERRLEGLAVFLDLSFPLHMELPPDAVPN